MDLFTVAEYFKTVALWLDRVINGEQRVTVRGLLFWLKIRISAALVSDTQRLVHDEIIKVCIRDIRREESNFEIAQSPEYLSAAMLVQKPGLEMEKTPLHDFTIQRTYYSSEITDSSNEGESEQGERSFLGLFELINERGYQPSTYGHIEVIIADDGEIKLRNGQRRLAILKAIDPNQTIEVKVVERSRGWLDFKRSVYETYGRKMYAYHPILHPDFANWTSLSYGPERLKAILDAIGDPKGKNVIDIGVQLGYFSFSLARMGAHVTGVDNGKPWVDLCEKFNLVYGTDATFHCGDFVSVLTRYQNKRWEYGLFLNVFHWLAFQRGGDVESVRRAMELLSRRIDKLFFSTGTLEQTGLLQSPLATVLQDTDVSRWICDNTDFKRCTRLFSDEKGRDLFLFTQV